MSEKYIFEEVEAKSKEIISEEVNDLLADKAFILSDCDFFIKQLNESIGKKLKENSDNFKYIINIIFLDNSNKGFTQNIGCVYDPDTDGVISMHFPFNKITCVVNLIITSI